MNLSTVSKGRITEYKCITHFLELGYIVSTPEFPCKYDFLLDIGNKILKIQVKTCRVSDDGTRIAFNVHSTTHNSNGYKIRTYSNNDVDYFCTFYDNECYLVPFDICGHKEKSLRLSEALNNQHKNISFANDYIAENVLSKYS